jgi:formylglycine-generating enzyme required for sulfatase activity
VHRDVTPANILLVGDQAKLIDFGIAKRAELPGRWLTVMGQLPPRTPGFAAPEQLRGERETGAADIFSLGVTLYTALTGADPTVDRTFSLMRTLDAVAPLIERMIAPEPTARPRAEEVALTLSALSSGAGLRIRTVSERGPHSVETSGELAERDFGTPSSELHVLESGAIADGAAQSRRSLWRSRGVLALLSLLAAVGVGGGAIYLRAPRHRERPRSSPAAIAKLPVVGADPCVDESGNDMASLSGGQFRFGITTEEAEHICAEMGDNCTATIRRLLREAIGSDEVTVSPFELQRCEVTNRDFADWVNGVKVNNVVPRAIPETVPEPGKPRNMQRYVIDARTGKRLLDLDPNYPDYNGIQLVSENRVRVRPGFERKPVVLVYADAASAYCADRGQRLPTEAESFFARRGLTGRRYPWGNEPITCNVVYGRWQFVMDGRKIPAQCDGPPGAADVGSSIQDVTPNGIHDLGGNVLEWTMDEHWFQRPHCTGSGCKNPVVLAPQSPDNRARVVIGGAWSMFSFSAQSFYRGRASSLLANPSIGFRCAYSNDFKPGGGT